jgi:hypothetical protein
MANQDTHRESPQGQPGKPQGGKAGEHPKPDLANPDNRNRQAGEGQNAGSGQRDARDRDGAHKPGQH